MSTPWRFVGSAFPGFAPITYNSDPGVYLSMPISPMVELQWRAKKIRFRMEAVVRWHGDKGTQSDEPPLNDVTTPIEMEWEETFPLTPAQKLPTIPSVGTWNRLFSVNTSHSTVFGVTATSVYQQGHPDTPTDDTKIIGYSISATLQLGIDPATNDARLDLADNGSDYKISVRGGIGVGVVIDGIDEVMGYNVSAVGVTIRPLKDGEISMGPITLESYEADDCLPNYSEAPNHAGLAMHLASITAEVIEWHPVPSPIG